MEPLTCVFSGLDIISPIRPRGDLFNGIIIYCREAAKHHEVHTLVFDQPASRPPGVTTQDCVNALSKFCASVCWLPLPKDLLGIGRYWRAFGGLVTGEPYEFRWLRSKEMARRLQRLASRFRFDVVHVDTLGLAPYVSLVPHAGTVLNHHDIESALVQRRADSERSLVWRKFWSYEAAHLLAAERRWCPSFHVNMVVSDDEGQLVKPSCGESKICVVPNGVDVEYFTPRPDPGGNRLLFCGRLDQLANKGAITYFFNSIWPELSSRVQNLEIDVVGKNPPAWLLELSQRDPRVHVPGFVDDVRPYFQKATVFVCPITRRWRDAFKNSRCLGHGYAGGEYDLCCLRSWVNRQKAFITCR